MDLKSVLKQLESALKTQGPRLNHLEAAVAAIKGRLRFWQLLALGGLGAAALLGWLWWRERARHQHQSLL